MSEIIYCANDPCESEAVYIIPKTLTPLCAVCGEAYTWGQHFIATEHIPQDRILDLLDYYRDQLE